MTLTIELGLDFIKVNPCTKFRDRTSNGLALRALTNWQTETRKDGIDSIASTADAGGKNTFEVYPNKQTQTESL